MIISFLISFFQKFTFCLKAKKNNRSIISFKSAYINSKFIFIGKNVFIGSRSVLMPIRSYRAQSFNAMIKIGDGAYIGHNTQLHCIGVMDIESECVISDYVYISDVAHGLSPLDGPIMQQLINSKGSIKLGRGTFVGYGASILPGVNLGEHCVVAARAVVTKSFPSFTMIAGSPARVIQKFDKNLGMWVGVDEL